MTTVSPPKTEINSVLTLYSNGQIQEALDAAKTLIKGYPNDPLLYNISGICYKTIGKLDEAVKSFEKALTVKPDYAEGAIQFSVLHSKSSVNWKKQFRVIRRRSLSTPTMLKPIITLA